jgi:hypothetical protein
VELVLIAFSPHMDPVSECDTSELALNKVRDP